MAENVPAVRLSTIDEERFGVRTARISPVSLETLVPVLHFCRSRDVVLLIARCPVADLGVLHAMEREGFRLMDTLLYHVRDLGKTPLPRDEGTANVRSMRSGDEDAVESVAAAAFRGYGGHYHADPRLDRASCDETYVSWARNLCRSKDPSGNVLVAVREGGITGFSAMRLNSSEEGETVLFGVAPTSQTLGISRSLLIRSMEWCMASGARRMIYSTQIQNVAIQKVLVRLGFEPSHAYYTLHKWFDEGGCT